MATDKCTGGVFECPTAACCQWGIASATSSNWSWPFGHVWVPCGDNVSCCRVNCTKRPSKKSGLHFCPLSESGTYQWCHGATVFYTSRVSSLACGPLIDKNTLCPLQVHKRTIMRTFQGDLGEVEYTRCSLPHSYHLGNHLAWVPTFFLEINKKKFKQTIWVSERWHKGIGNTIHCSFLQVI